MGLRIEEQFNRFTRPLFLIVFGKQSRVFRDYESSQTQSFLRVDIHPYPQLGHQISSWIAGYLWAKDLGMNFEGGEVTQDKLGLFDFQKHISTNNRTNHVSIRLPPVSDERDLRSLLALKFIISFYDSMFRNKNKSFRLSLDPSRWDQTPAASALRSSLIDGYKGKEFSEIENKENYVAIHIRRGDIHRQHISGLEKVDRWVDEEWHLRVIEQIRSSPKFSSTEIRIYALGNPSDFPELQNLGVVFRFNGDRDTDLIEMAAAKLLVLSPSSFSFTAALCSTGLVIGRVPWWHNIPNSGRWIQADEFGSFDVNRLN